MRNRIEGACWGGEARGSGQSAGIHLGEPRSADRLSAILAVMDTHLPGRKSLVSQRHPDKPFGTCHPSTRPPIRQRFQSPEEFATSSSQAGRREEGRLLDSPRKRTGTCRHGVDTGGHEMPLPYPVLSDPPCLLPVVRQGICIQKKRPSGGKLVANFRPDFAQNEENEDFDKRRKVLDLL